MGQLITVPCYRLSSLSLQEPAPKIHCGTEARLLQYVLYMKTRAQLLQQTWQQHDAKPAHSTETETSRYGLAREPH